MAAPRNAHSGNDCTSKRFLSLPRNVRVPALRLRIKSPLRQRAHSPLSPKCARYYLFASSYSSIPSNSVVLRYLSAASGRITTIVLPANSGCSRQAHSHGHGRPAGNSRRESLPPWPAAAPSSMDSSLANQFHTVHHRQVQGVRNEPGADSLNLVRPRLQRLATRASA